MQWHVLTFIFLLLSFIFPFMAGPKGSKYYDIFLKQSIKLITNKDDMIINEEGFRLLSEVSRENSIVAAARNLEMSYRKAWGLLREVENTLGFRLVRKHRGGKDGGKTFLSTEGTELVEAYNVLINELEMASHDPVKGFFNRINEIKDRI